MLSLDIHISKLAKMVVVDLQDLARHTNPLSSCLVRNISSTRK
jgi:hypothetical protein